MYVDTGGISLGLNVLQAAMQAAGPSPDIGNAGDCSGGGITKEIFVYSARH